MKELIVVFKNRKCLYRMLISGGLFITVSAPFKVLFNLIPGVTEIRPANMIPVVLGLIWGPAAAWGTALANAFLDVFVSHSPVQVWMPGFFINFFYSYLPYKLWYSMKGGQGESQLPSFGHVDQAIKYAYICLIDSLVVTTFLGLLFEVLGFQAFSASVLLLFFNNFDFSIVLGVPAILILTNFKSVGFWIPSELYQAGREGRPAGKKVSGYWFDMLLYLVAAGGIVYYLMGVNGMAALPPQVNQGLLMGIGVILLIYLCKPLDSLKEVKDEAQLAGISIRAKVIIGFLLLSVAFVLIIGTSAYISLGNGTASRFETWQYIYTVVGIALNIMFVISLIFLKYVETNITGPLELLSRMVQGFSARDHRKSEANRMFLKSYQEVHTGDEIEMLSDSFRRMMSDITDYVENLEFMTREKERLGAELNIATQIQADMLPRIFPAFPDRKEFDIYASMTPAKEVGGDFYDFFLIDEIHLAVVIADVSGKGVPAALFMVIAKTLIKNHTQLGAEPTDVFAIVNNQLCEGNKAGLFVTAWLGILNISTGECSFVNAGHNPPLLLRSHEDGSRSFEYLRSKADFVLAGMEDMQYTPNRIQLSVGDKLFLYTDGVTEAENRQEQLYGEERLKARLNERKLQPAKEIVIGIKDSVTDFADGAEQFDDITIVTLIYHGGKNV